MLGYGHAAANPLGCRSMRRMGVRGTPLTAAHHACERSLGRGACRRRTCSLPRVSPGTRGGLHFNRRRRPSPRLRDRSTSRQPKCTTSPRPTHTTSDSQHGGTTHPSARPPARTASRASKVQRVPVGLTRKDHVFTMAPLTHRPIRYAAYPAYLYLVPWLRL